MTPTDAAKLGKFGEVRRWRIVPQSLCNRAKLPRRQTAWAGRYVSVACTQMALQLDHSDHRAGVNP
jgi:hypothetical protein